MVVRWFLRISFFKLIRKIDDTGTVDRRSAPGSGRPRTADKIDEVDDLVLNQDIAPNTHRTQRQIARQTASHRR